jgi:transposase-like protein
MALTAVNLPASEDAAVRARLQWVQHYEQKGDAGLTCRRCGISRPTLRKWWRRYQENGLDGFSSRSRRRHQPPARQSDSRSGSPDILAAPSPQEYLGPRSLQSEM